MTTQFSQYLAQADELCRRHDARLLFLSLFGSTLYGTELAATSDIDIRGIFLPSAASLQFAEPPQHVHYSTGTSERRNSAGDVDIDLWSLQHWLLTLLPAGDIGAIDMLFAPSHQACTLYRSALLDDVFAHPLQYVDVFSNRSYAQYSIGQAKKYGIYGSRIGALRRVAHWVNEHAEKIFLHERLHIYLADIVRSCSDSSFCFIQETPTGTSLSLCGKLYLGNIRMKEFIQRIQTDMQLQGARAVDAEQNKGIDYKALSHAIRALMQMEELLLTGKIVFPLQKRAELLTIKKGHFTWLELEPYILERLAVVDKLQKEKAFDNMYDRQHAEACVLQCYQTNREK